MRFSALVLGLLALSGAVAQDNGGGNGEVQNGNNGGNDGGNNNNGNDGGNNNGGGGGGNNNNQPSASASTSASASASGNNGANATSAVNSGNASTSLPPGAFVTTVTSVFDGRTATLAFTLTAPLPQATGNATVNGNSTLNGTDIYGNGTNGTAVNETQPWNDTLGYLPFKVKLDPAYGVAGALMILSGIPVATLGGKNRWSALAIISGYSVALFCLIMILSFG